ncbi:LysR family transcriptional regulator [Pseudonocardia alni]|uniref:LysR family transcriptional regulator n=1 Tax=Pseudonocardia alni TaxID=33907 RepID=UPI00280B75B9|nr:LysR family transcriptional regulator [Pseudonocardia alni]
MELRQLEIFLAVADTGSFTAAAGSVHLVQSAVSVAIRALERDLGAALFERTSRRVALTEAGAALVAPARTTLAAAASARDVVEEVTGGTRGTVAVGIMHGLPGVDLAALLQRFHRQRPRVTIRPGTAPDGTAGLVRGVLEHRLDLALAAVDPSLCPPALEAHELFREPIRLACPPGHRLSGRGCVPLTELSGESFIDVPPGWGSRESGDRVLAAHGVVRDVVIEVGDVATVAELVRAGLGLALLAPSSAPGPARHRLVDLAPHPEFTVSLVTARDRAPSAAAAHLIRLVRHAAAEAGATSTST